MVKRVCSFLEIALSISYRFAMTQLGFLPSTGLNWNAKGRRNSWLTAEPMRCSLSTPTPETAEDARSGEPEKWQTGKIQAHRPIRGVRRAVRGTLSPQGRRSRKNEPLRMPPSVRITSGSARGRKLMSPSVYLRPMMGKVREAVFSMLIQFDAVRPDGSALDLFAGLGSVGMEALSRGFASAVFVDSSPECIAAIERNASHCRLDAFARTVCERVEEFLPRAAAMNNGEPYALITVTPPYEEVDYSQLLTEVARSDAVGEGTFVVVEYPVELGSLPPVIEHRLIGVRNRRYGRTVIAIYACQPRTDLELRPEEFTLGLK